MEAFYILLFAVIAATTVLFELGKGRSSSASSSSATSLTRDFLAFRNNYVLVYALMMGEKELCFLVRFAVVNAIFGIELRQAQRAGGEKGRKAANSLQRPDSWGCKSFFQGGWRRREEDRSNRGRAAFSRSLSLPPWTLRLASPPSKGQRALS